MFFVDIEVATKLVRPLAKSPYQIATASALSYLTKNNFDDPLIDQMVEGTNRTMWLFDDQEDRVTLYLKCIVESARFLGRKFDHADERMNDIDRRNNRVQCERLWSAIDELKLLVNKK